MKKLKIEKESKLNKKFVYLTSGGVFLLGIIVILGLNLNQLSETTNSPLYIEYYGVSDQLMSNRAGKIQTYIKLKQPFLRTLSTPDGRTELAQNITDTVNFTEGIVDLYQNNPPASLLSNTSYLITLGADKEEDNFRNNKACLKKIGSNHRNHPRLYLALVSELKYQRCSRDKNILFAYIKHTFFNHEEGSFICSQEDDKLFLVGKKTGIISLDVSNC